MTSTTTAPRWVDSTGAAWPVTGDWCAICAMPLLVTEPGQTSHPNCEDFPDVHSWPTPTARTSPTSTAAGGLPTKSRTAPGVSADADWCAGGTGQSAARRRHGSQTSPTSRTHEEGAA